MTSLTDATAITAGGAHSCALLTDSTVRCWGRGDEAQLGDRATIARPTPVAVLEPHVIGSVGQVAAGDSHTCALSGHGVISCWGNNVSGQLGVGTTTDRLTPGQLAGVTGATAIAAGNSHTCAVLADSSVACWGYNGSGQLGDGTTTDRVDPVPVTGLTGATALTAGTGHTCALLADGSVTCWGFNGFGQLGDGTNTNRTSPTPVTGITTATRLTAGGSHTCALLTDGTTSCQRFAPVFGSKPSSTSSARLARAACFSTCGTA